VVCSAVECNPQDAANNGNNGNEGFDFELEENEIHEQESSNNGADKILIDHNISRNSALYQRLVQKGLQIKQLRSTIENADQERNNLI
jgi:hypothetical protein